MRNLALSAAEIVVTCLVLVAIVILAVKETT